MANSQKQSKAKKKKNGDQHCKKPSPSPTPTPTVSSSNKSEQTGRKKKDHTLPIKSDVVEDPSKSKQQDKDQAPSDGRYLYLEANLHAIGLETHWLQKMAINLIGIMPESVLSQFIDEGRNSNTNPNDLVITKILRSTGLKEDQITEFLEQSRSYTYKGPKLYYRTNKTCHQNS